MAVVTALEFQNEIALRESARQPRGRHCRFRSRADEADFLDRGYRALYPFREFDFQLRSDAVARPARRLILNCSDDGGMPVAQDQCAPGAHIVDVFVAVRVPKPRARAALHDHWFAADRSELTYLAVHSSDQRLLSAPEDVLRFLAGGFCHVLNS